MPGQGSGGVLWGGGKPAGKIPILKEIPQELAQNAWEAFADIEERRKKMADQRQC